MKKVNLLFFLLLFSFQIHAQEICTNGIDDDNDGLIDLNDTTDCRCNGLHGSTVLHSYIPNPSFEQSNCCPFTYSQMNCAAGWMQASFATTDYMSHCPGGYVGGAVAAAGLNNFPDGDAIVGCIFQPNWQEYIGSCLLQPMQAGTSYTIQFSIASTPVDGQGGICNNGNIFYGPVDVTIFGSTSCANLPFAGTACPAAPAWRIMGKATYTPASQWGLLTITFTPTFNVNAIILGAPCALPASYNNNLGCSPYFYFDNLVLNTTSAFAQLNVDQSGIPCLNNVVLNSHTDTMGGAWQWFKNGIAISGQTDSILQVSSNNLGDGYYTAMYSLGNQCQLSGDTVISNNPEVVITSHSDVYCDGGNDGNAYTSVSGGYGSISYEWNTSPPQLISTASGLTAGQYIITITDSVGCQARDTVNIQTLHPSPVSVSVQSICNGEVYSFNGHNYMVSGNYSDTLVTNFGCDSVVITQLTVLNSYIRNNPQWICNGESYNFNGHVYFIPGIYYDTLQTVNGCDSIIQTTLAHAASFNANNPVTICNGESYILNAHHYNLQGTYVDTLVSSHGCDSVVTTQLTVLPVYVADNFQSICQGESYRLLSHVYTEAGMYRDTIESIFGCDSVIITRLTVKALPQLTFNKPSDICIDGDPFLLEGGLPAGGIYSGTGVHNNRFDPSSATAGTHTITYSFMDNGTHCSNSVSQSISVFALPEIQFNLNPKVAFLEDSKINYLDYTSNAKNWKWDFGDNEESQSRYGYHVYTDTGYFRVDLYVMDNNGCSSKTSDYIYIGLDFVFNVPNAFTPNGDGVNDSFKGIGIGIGKYKMSIFNRWGEEVFTSNDLFKAWKGENAISDTYVYKVNLEDITGRVFEYVGSVTLIR